MANKSKYGISNVYYAVETEDNSGVSTYGTPVALPEAVSLSLDAEGSEYKKFADNVPYYVDFNNGGYSGDFEITELPDQFKTDCLGMVVDANGGLVETADAKTKGFALMGQIDGDAMNRRFVFYKGKASRPGFSAETTEDAKEAQDDTLSVSFAAAKLTGWEEKIVRYALPDTGTGYNNFFSAVPVPTPVSDTDTDTDTDTGEE